jgi:hypothetical protein
MAVTDEFYSSDRLRLPEESAFAGYMRGFMGQRAKMNADAAAAARPDTKALADQAIELRRRLGDLAKLREAQSRGDTEAQAGILEAMLRYEGTVQSARIRGQATESAARIRARETALRNAIRQNEKLSEELGLAADSGRLLAAMGDGVSKSATTAPRTALASANEALNAVLSNEKAAAGSAKADAATYRAYQELVAAGQPEAATELWVSRGYGPTDPAAYMAERWGMETPQETLALQREIERGGVGRADSAGALAERYAAYGTGGSSSRSSTTSGSGGGTPAQPSSARVSGVPMGDALAAFMANPSDPSMLDALIADTQRAIAENEAAQRSASTAIPGRLPNLLLANPYQVVREESYEPFERLSAMPEAGRNELVSTLMTTRGPFGQVRPEVAEARQQSMGGINPEPQPWAGIPTQGTGPSVFGWLYGRVKLAEVAAAKNPGAPRRISDDGGWVYDQQPDGSILVVQAPPGSVAAGTTLKSGPAWAAINQKFGGYVHPAIAGVRDDLAKLPPSIRSRMGGVDAWLMRGDASAAGKEALTLAEKDRSTFGEAYSAALETAAKRGDAVEAGAVLDSMAALPDGTGGAWSDAYMESVKRGTLREDMPRIRAVIHKPAPAFEMEPVGQSDPTASDEFAARSGATATILNAMQQRLAADAERDPKRRAEMESAATRAEREGEAAARAWQTEASLNTGGYRPPSVTSVDDYSRERAIREKEVGFYNELAPFSFSEDEKRAMARATAEKVVGGGAVDFDAPPPPPPPVVAPVQQPVAPARQPAPAPVMDLGTTDIPAPVAAMPPVMDFGTTAFPGPADPLATKQSELASLIASMKQDEATKARKKQLTDEINAMKGQIGATVDPSLAAME